MKMKFISLIVIIMGLSFYITLCTNEDPAYYPKPMPKHSPPSDHTSDSAGAMHKPGRRYPFLVNENATWAGLGLDVEEGASGACVICHGNSDDGWELTGGTLENGIQPPSCYTCHDKKWNGEASDYTPPVFNPTDTEHGPNNGYVYRTRRHGVNHNTPYTNNATDNTPACTGCHGDYLKGDKPEFNGTNPPSCYTCHGVRWDDGTSSGSGGGSSGGTVGPTIYNPPKDHTVSNRGRLHKPGYLKPYFVNKGALGPGTGADPQPVLS